MPLVLHSGFLLMMLMVNLPHIQGLKCNANAGCMDARVCVTFQYGDRPLYLGCDIPQEAAPFGSPNALQKFNGCVRLKEKASLKRPCCFFHRVQRDSLCFRKKKCCVFATATIATRESCLRMPIGASALNTWKKPKPCEPRWSLGSETTRLIRLGICIYGHWLV